LFGRSSTVEGPFRDRSRTTAGRAEAASDRRAIGQIVMLWVGCGGGVEGDATEAGTAAGDYGVTI
jgi:hypothetical protein